jgi:membrane protease YdiL (CAAX protease family)
MTAGAYEIKPQARPGNVLAGVLLFLATMLFGLFFFLVNDAYFLWASATFPNVTPTVWGILSRAYLLIAGGLVVLWRPRLFGFQLGKTRQHLRLLLLFLLLNCGTVAVFLWLTGSSPYSGNEWLITEVVTVPLVEEMIWRGLVMTGLLIALRRVYPENTTIHLAVWYSGLCFGLLHATNLFYGVPFAFVLPQTANAIIWGIVYGYARARTDSIYPPMFLHAAMNLVVVLF